MGDRRRFIEFAFFIQRTFPGARRIADVAGGHGELAFRLNELGKQTVIVDPRQAAFPRWIDRILRKRTVRERRLSTIECIHKPVEAVDLSDFDLVVALHPDEATEPALRAAIAAGVDFAIVPCCVFPLDGVHRSRSEWLSYLASLAPGIRLDALPIAGANIVLWRKSDKPIGQGGCTPEEVCP